LVGKCSYLLVIGDMVNGLVIGDMVNGLVIGDMVIGLDGLSGME